MARQRDDRWCGEVTNELRHINSELAGINERLERLEQTMLHLFAEHKEYHHANEPRWGLLTWAQRHPVRFAVAVGALLLWLATSDTSLLSGLLRNVVLRLAQ